MGTSQEEKRRKANAGEGLETGALREERLRHVKVELKVNVG